MRVGRGCTAKALKAEVEDHLARGRDWFPVEEDQCPTVDEIIDKYVEVTAARLRARTHRRYAENLAPIRSGRIRGHFGC